MDNKTTAGHHLLMNYICKNYNANLIQVKTINEHYFRTQLVKNRHVVLVDHENDDDDGNNNTAVELELDLVNIKIIYSNLTNAYESLLQRNNSHSTASATVTSATFHMDERMFFEKSPPLLVDKANNPDEMMDSPVVNTSSRSLTLTETCKYDLKISNCLHKMFAGSTAASSSSSFVSFIENSPVLADLGTVVKSEFAAFLNQTIRADCCERLKKVLLDSLILNVSLKNNYLVVVSSFINILIQNYKIQNDAYPYSICEISKSKKRRILFTRNLKY
jgi:hypothetical protein